MHPLVTAFVPSIAVLAVVSIITIVLSLISSKKVTFIQSTLFLCAFAYSISYLTSHGSKELTSFVASLQVLSEETRIALSAVVVVAVYFGGSFFVTSKLSNESSSSSSSSSGTKTVETPATEDSQLHFDVPTNLPRDDKDLFNLVFDRIKREIIADLPRIYELPTESVSYVDRMIEYTVAGGKMNRGLATIAVIDTLFKASGKKLTNKVRLQAAALGWCIEYLQAFFLVADDIMDASETRRGQPCWFRLGEVRLVAINDSFILESCVYKILKRYFGTEPYYVQLVDLFLEVTRQTEIGQLLDLTSQPQEGAGEIDLERFTPERYSGIVKYKTAYYSFYLPVALAMIIAGVTSKAQYDQARNILLLMGEYFQVQDDYLDCYGAPEVIGKVGTDIQDNKCSWLVVQALRLSSPAQRQVLIDNYGKHDMKKVERVKVLYRDLKLEARYHAYEEQAYTEIKRQVALVKDVPPAVFEFLLYKIYKRSK